MSNPYRIQQDTVNNLEGSLDDKQDKLTAGTGITIDENNVISAEVVSAPEWGDITGTLSNQTDLNTILESKADETELNSHINNSTVHVSSTDKSNWDGKQDALTAGEGIDIENNVISCTVTGATWGNITGTIGNQTDLINYIDNIVGDIETLLSQI